MEILNVLQTLWVIDIDQLSKAWMYYWFLMPALFYIMFMLAKWSILLIPIWVPIVSAIKFSRISDNKEGK